VSEIVGKRVAFPHNLPFLPRKAAGDGAIMRIAGGGSGWLDFPAEWGPLAGGRSER
jgi:hypothetical protein